MLSGGTSSHPRTVATSSAKPSVSASASRTAKARCRSRALSLIGNFISSSFCADRRGLVHPTYQRNAAQRRARCIPSSLRWFRDRPGHAALLFGVPVPLAKPARQLPGPLFRPAPTTPTDSAAVLAETRVSLTVLTRQVAEYPALRLSSVLLYI